MKLDETMKRKSRKWLLSFKDFLSINLSSPTKSIILFLLVPLFRMTISKWPPMSYKFIKTHAMVSNINIFSIKTVEIKRAVRRENLRNSIGGKLWDAALPDDCNFVLRTPVAEQFVLL